MTARDILAEFEAQGIEFHTPDGEKLRVRAPGELGDELRARIQAHKTDIIRAIQLRELTAWGSRGWLAIYSAHLGEVIILARDEQAATAAPAGFITYIGDEVELLLGASPDGLRQVHEVKRHFGGRITGKELPDT